MSALPAEEYQRLIDTLQPITLSLGELVYDSGGHLDYIYFPTTAVVSLLYTMKDGSTAEMGTRRKRWRSGCCSIPQRATPRPTEP